MPNAASAALRAAVHDALTGNAGLISVLGGPKIYDEPPREAAFPYVTLGETASRIFPPAASRRSSIS